MTFVRRTVATIVTLTIGISAAWIIESDRQGNQSPAASASPSGKHSLAVSKVDSLDNAAQVASALERSGNAAAPSAAELYARAELGQKRSEVIAKFDTWAERYARSTPEERKDSLADGIAIARERQPLMLDLIRNNPRQAIEAADQLSPLARKEMPAEVAEYVERMVSGKGDLEVLGVLTADGNGYERTARIGDQTYSTYTYGKRQEPIPEKNTPLIGVSLPVTDSVEVNGQSVERRENVLALREEKSRVLSKAEVALARQAEVQPAVRHCPVSGDETTAHADESAVDVGGEVIWLCKEEHVAPYIRSATASGDSREAAVGGPGEGAGSFPATTVGWNTGNKNVIAIRVRFPSEPADPFVGFDFDAIYRDTCMRLNQYSYGRVNLAYNVAPTIITLPHDTAWYQAQGGGDTPLDRIADDATAAADAAGYNASGYNFRSIILATNAFGDWGGKGMMPGAVTWIRWFGARWVAHELGHNLGLPHANSWNPTTPNPLGPGSHGEYWGAYNSMNNWTDGAYDTMMRFYLRWLTYNEAHNVTSNGTYRIYDPDVTNLGAGRRYTIRMSKQVGQFYFVEFRPRATALADGAPVNATTQNGIRILRTNGSEQLDVTHNGGDMSDAAVVVGQAFTDPESGITIAPIAKGGNGTDQYMDVSVTFTAPTLYSGGVYELQPQCAPALALM